MNSICLQIVGYFLIIPMLRCRWCSFILLCSQNHLSNTDMIHYHAKPTYWYLFPHLQWTHRSRLRQVQAPAWTTSQPPSPLTPAGTRHSPRSLHCTPASPSALGAPLRRSRRCIVALDAPARTQSQPTDDWPTTALPAAVGRVDCSGAGGWGRRGQGLTDCLGCTERCPVARQGPIPAADERGPCGPSGIDGAGGGTGPEVESRWRRETGTRTGAERERNGNGKRNKTDCWRVPMLVRRLLTGFLIRWIVVARSLVEVNVEWIRHIAHTEVMQDLYPSCANNISSDVTSPSLGGNLMGETGLLYKQVFLMAFDPGGVLNRP